MQRKRSLARAFRTIDLDDPAARQTADTECDIKPQRAGRNGIDVPDRTNIPHAHHGALSELLLDLAQCGTQGLALVVFHLAPPSKVVCLWHSSVWAQVRNGQDYPTDITGPLAASGEVSDSWRLYHP